MKHLLTKIVTILLISAFTCTAVMSQEKETRKLPSFNKISVGESIEVVIEQGDENVAYIEARGIDVDKVLTEVNGSKLQIHMNKGWYMSVDVYIRLVYTDDLKGIKVSSSSDLKSKTLLKANELFLQVSSSGSADVEVDVRDLDIDISSSGNLYVGGQTETLNLEASSSGKVDGFDLTCGSANADMSSSGRAEITVVDKLIAEASSSGKLTYKGDPNKVIVDASSSGRVRKY